MSQKYVERTIGRLVTDEAFRRAYLEDRKAVLRGLAEAGDLTPCEYRAMLTLDSRLLERCAGGIDPRLQKSDLHGGDRENA